MNDINDSAASATAHSVDLIVAIDGFEGPIDLLLTLAREQKVDLAKIAILPLAEQYLAFISDARRLRLEIAADYLVMAAWLAYLKSRLLLPPPEAAEAEAQDAAALGDALRFQLLRLEAMQQAVPKLMARPQLGQDVFLRGQPEPIKVEDKPIYYLPLQDLLTALGAPLRRRKPEAYQIKVQRLYSLEDSVHRLRRLIGHVPSWSTLQAFLPEQLKLDFDAPELETRSAVASTFAAMLELVKSGEIELRQDGCFAPIYARPRQASPTTINEGITDDE